MPKDRLGLETPSNASSPALFQGAGALIQLPSGLRQDPSPRCGVLSCREPTTSRFCSTTSPSAPIDQMSGGIAPAGQREEGWGLNTPSNASSPALFQGAGALVQPPPPLNSDHSPHHQGDMKSASTTTESVTRLSSTSTADCRRTRLEINAPDSRSKQNSAHLPQGEPSAATTSSTR